MYYPVSLRVQNLFTYQDTTVDFLRRKGRMTCIYGLNLTDPKVLSNGSGKTSLLDCVAIALTGTPLRDIAKKSIVRNGQTSGVLEFTLRNDVLKTELRIVEYVERSKGNRVEVWENGVLNTQLKDLAPKDAHKHILSLLDISEDDLLNYYLLGKDTYTSFFLAKDGDKKEVINRFSKANIVDPIDGLIVEDIKVEEQVLVELNKEVAAKQARINILSEQIEQLRLVDGEEEIQKQLKIIEDQVDGLTDSVGTLRSELGIITRVRKEQVTSLAALEKDTTTADALAKAADQITKLQNQVKKEREKYDAIEKKYEIKTKDIDKKVKEQEGLDETDSKDLTTLTKQVSEIERHLADGIECPACQHVFCLKDKEYDLKAAKKQLPQIKKVMEETEQRIITRSAGIADLKGARKKVTDAKASEQEVSIKEAKKLNLEIAELNQGETQLRIKDGKHKCDINDLKIKIADHDTQATIRTNAIAAKGAEIETLLVRMEEVAGAEIEDNITPVQLKVAGEQEELDAVLADVETVTTKLTDLQTWRKRFKGFKSHLANNSIGMIEALSNDYLGKMGTHLTVAIDGFREKADGTLKEEITTEVSRDGGVSAEEFGKFSGGERAKVDVAGILSMQKIINLNSRSGGLDLLWIDEIIDSMDRISLAELVSSLETIGQTILIISHIELPPSENVIRVEKRLGISKLVEN